MTSFYVIKFYFVEDGRQFEITRVRHDQKQRPIFIISVSFITRFDLNFILWKAAFSSRLFKFRHCLRQLSLTIDLYFTFVFIISSSSNYVPEGISVSVCTCSQTVSAFYLLCASIFFEVTFYCNGKIHLHSLTT